jgi:hypothetical protein
MFVFLAASFGGMQCYVEWQKRRLKILDQQVSSNIVSDFPRNPPSDVIRRSGVFSFCVVGLAFGHLCLMLFFPERSKDEFYYIAKVSDGIKFSVLANDIQRVGDGVLIVLVWFKNFT